MITYYTCDLSIFAAPSLLFLIGLMKWIRNHFYLFHFHGNRKCAAMNEKENASVTILVPLELGWAKINNWSISIGSWLIARTSDETRFSIAFSDKINKQWIYIQFQPTYE